MHVTSADDCNDVIRRFNAFHDAFALEVRWFSSMRFTLNMPWEPERKFSSNDERLLSVGMTALATEKLVLVLAHYNYDWPNQPIDRVVEITFAGNLQAEHQHVSCSTIRELTFRMSGAAVECIIDWAPFAPGDPPISASRFAADHVSLNESIRRLSD